ncbi:MAG: threonine ammonia-lyase [Gammaproteobacteria bacterium]
MAEMAIDYSDIQLARSRIARYWKHPTPVVRWRAFEERTDVSGLRIYVKCENLGPTGSFKLRGALNAVLALSEHEARHGVATHSSGNHGAALAYAARIRGVPVTIVVPKGASRRKTDLIRQWGGTIVECEPTQAGREDALARVVREQGSVAIPPYDWAPVMAGQGTVTDEFLDEIPALDYLLIPVGGGGLISGAAIVARMRRPSIQLIGVEPQGANDTLRSLERGMRVPHPAPMTVADGLKAFVGELTFPIIQKMVDRVVDVTEAEITKMMLQCLEELRMVVEPSSATVFAALTKERLTPGSRVGLILSGGNVDQTLWERLFAS